MHFETAFSKKPLSKTKSQMELKSNLPNETNIGYAINFAEIPCPTLEAPRLFYLISIELINKRQKIDNNQNTLQNTLSLTSYSITGLFV